MALPWVVWLAVGAAVALWSLKLGTKFTLFFYAGLVFVAIGLVKMVIALLTRSPEHTAKHQPGYVHQHAPVHQHGQSHSPQARHVPAHPVPGAQHPQAAHTANHYQQQAQVFACPRCHAQVNHVSYFCSQCGMRIR